jgi:AraC-like DNA-binding protein
MPKRFKSFMLVDKNISEEMAVVDVGYEKCEPSHRFGPYRRSYYLFHFVVSGKGVLRREDGEYNVSANQAFLIRPNEITVYSADAEEPWEYVWLGIRGKGAEALINEHCGNDCVFDISRSFIQEMTTICHTVAADSNEIVYRMTGMAYKMFAELLVNESSSAEAKRMDVSEIVKKAVAFMETNYFRSFDIGWLAGELGMSRAHFTTVFTSIIGKSPYNYLTRYRIGKAQNLLMTCNLNVSEIANACGFSSVGRFDAMFRKYIGSSPNEYRSTK